MPTLNEEKYIGGLLTSLQLQTQNEYELIVVDGGSNDRTEEIAQSFGSRLFRIEGSKEFEARNFGAMQSRGSILVFVCADVIFPPRLLATVDLQFKSNENLVAMTGPGFPYEGTLLLRCEYGLYNLVRFAGSKLPTPVKRFSTSTNFLAVKAQVFKDLGGFESNDVNADGLMGRRLVQSGPVLFDQSAAVYVSGRRYRRMGIARFNAHYLYVLENFLPSLSTFTWFRRLKMRSAASHRQLHKV